MARAVTALVVAALAAGPVAGAAGPAAPAPPPAAIPQSPAAWRERVLELGAKGRLTADLLAAFRAYAAATAREKLVPQHVPEAFWDRAAADKVFGDGLLVELHPKYEPGIAAALKALQDHAGKKLDTHKHLALAFAVVYGRGGKAGVLDPHLRGRYFGAGRTAPSPEESFDYYLKYERAMKMPPAAAPWPLLCYVADNDAPIAEREWALARYAKAAAWGRIYYDVPYDTSRVSGSGRLGDLPYTLPNIQSHGGVCMERAYFSSRVLKSLGVPALFTAGEGKRGGHAWVSWVALRGRQVDLQDAGRFDFDKYYRGVTFCPMTRGRVLDREVALLGAAMAHSYAGWIDARLACHVYDLFQGDGRRAAAGVLQDAVNRNPYHAGTWRRLADAVAEGVLAQRQGEQAYDLMLRHFGTQPDLTFEVLQKILSPRLTAGEGTPAAEVTRNLSILEKAFQIYEKAKRPDLAVMLRRFQGEYLEAVGRKDAALRLYVVASEQYAAEHYGFLDLFDRAMALMTDEAMRLKYLAIMAEKVPEYGGDFNRQFKQRNAAFTHVVRAYVEALQAGGKSAEAAKWEARLKA